MVYFIIDERIRHRFALRSDYRHRAAVEYVYERAAKTVREAAAERIFNEDEAGAFEMHRVRILVWLLFRVNEHGPLDLPVGVPHIHIDARIAVEDKPAGVDLYVIELPGEVCLRQPVRIDPAIEIVKGDAVEIESLRRVVGPDRFDPACSFVAFRVELDVADGHMFGALDDAKERSI